MAEFSASLWDKDTDQEKFLPTRQHASVMVDPTPAVPEAKRYNTHYTPAYVDTRQGMFDVEDYVPKEAILDIRATKVMLNKNFAAALQINASNLGRGAEYVTASGAVEMPLGVPYGKVKFALARGTPHMYTVWLFVTIVDTTAYDVLLGMEFMTTVGGAHDSYTEKFKYRSTREDGSLRTHEIYMLTFC